MRFPTKLWQKMTKTGCLASFPRGSNGIYLQERVVYALH